jgi:hypothetical protein
MHQGDNLVLLLVVILLGYWIWTALKRWLIAPLQRKSTLQIEDEIPLSDAVALLEQSGYEVITTKRRISLRILLNDAQELESRLFVDHFAQQKDKLYAVKLAKERKPLEMTGSAIRDQLLVYQLLYEEVVGILYVDMSNRTIHKIEFEMDL